MADKPTNRERIKEIVSGIEDNIKELFQSEKYFDYLKTMSRFHSYSVNNTILIHMQRPDASLVAGFNTWKNRFGRHVNRGEKGITIIAPTPFKKKIEEMKLDPDTKAPILDRDGNAIIEEKTVEIPMFKPVKVFDVSQTSGKPLPQIAADLTGDVRQFEIFMEALRRTAPVPMTVEKVSPGMDGYFDPNKQRIAIREGMSQVQTICAAVHEIAHSKLHNYEQARLAAAAGGEEPPKPKDRKTEEVEAESISYAVCQYYGIDTSANSMGYIAGWSSGRDLKELKASLETITKTTSSLIKDIDHHFSEICKERGIDLTAQQEQAAPEVQVQSQPETVYKMEANPLTTGAEDRFFLQAYDVTDKAALIPSDVLFYGSAAQCLEVKNKLEAGAVTPQEVREQYIREHPPIDVPDTPERFAADLHAHMTALADHGIAVLSVHKDLQGHYLDCVKQGRFESLRDYLRESAEYTGTLNTALMDRLDALQAQWEATLNYQVQPYLPDSAIDRAYVQAFYPMDGEMVHYDSLFVGTIAHCNELAEKLNARTITAQEVRDMPGDDWPPFTPPAKPVQEQPKPPEPGEALYLIDNAAYLHVQLTDTGIDYTFFDKETMRQLDGGQLDYKDPDRIPEKPLESACQIICAMESKRPGHAEAVPLDMLETLLDAQFEQPTPPNPHYEELVEHMLNADDSVSSDQLPDAPETVLDEYPRLDPDLTAEDLERCGYLDGDLLPLSRERAVELIEKDMTVYILDSGENPAMAFDREEIEEQSPGVLFAVPREEWEASQDFRQAVADRMNHQEERESAFLHHVEPCFAIYQVKEGPETRDYRFEPLDRLTARGEQPQREHYELAYTAPLPEDADLDALWQKFNTDHPPDYQRPSLSMSDIVAVNMDGMVTCHYVDRVGFATLSSFLPQDNPLRNAEMAMEDDYGMIDGIINNGPKEGPSVAELEAQVKAGQSISLMDLAGAVQREHREKKSVMARLHQKPPKQEKKRTAPKKSAERDR